MEVVSRRDAQELGEMQCCDAWAEHWNLRVGPNYKKTGAKGPSPPSLYEFVAVDLWTSARVINQIGSRIQLPQVEFNTHGLPPIFIMNIQAPHCENPSMWSPPLDGKTMNVVYIFKIKRSTAEAAADLASAEPALRLWAEYVKSAPGTSAYNESFRGRMKLMMTVDQGLPKMFQRYNGKPTLLTKSSTVTQGPNFFEIDANLRHWCYPAKAGIYSMWGAIPKIRINMCCTIEGREDEELNECALGVCTVSCMDFDNSPSLE